MFEKFKFHNYWSMLVDARRRKLATKTFDALQMSDMGKARDCFGLFGKDGKRIY